MPSPSPLSSQRLPLSDTGTSDIGSEFIETLEYRRFVEFCDACRRYRYIGLCYGTPGIGKTLSAIHYSRADSIVLVDRWTEESKDGVPIDTVLYTPAIVNTPSGVASDLGRARERVDGIAKRPIRREAREVLDAIRLRDDAAREEFRSKPSREWTDPPALKPTYMEIHELYDAREKAIGTATSLILIDEADRLRMTSLEQVRDIFDEGTVGLILIGMPGIEKRMARYPQFYSRIGFVHEFRPLATTEMRELLERRWTPHGVTLPDAGLGIEAIAAVIRMTGGNFRLLNRLLRQVERILDVILFT
jgi:DNA transposition AAA+ family ATPase